MRKNNDCGCGITPGSSCDPISTSTTKCRTVVARPFDCAPDSCAPPPLPCIPTVPSHPTVTIENLLSLIEAKCDKGTCDIIRFEIDMLFIILNITKPDGTNPNVVIPPVGFQLISNMIDSLQGDLTDKYPSATLLKVELEKLWKCMYDKQQHHGRWATNFVMRDLSHPENENCLIDGEPWSIPNQLKVIVPVDVGSTVYHIVEGKECLFESLVDNNITEPSKMSVLDGKWFSYCDLKDVIDCVIPRRKLVDCKNACDDPNGDGIIEEQTLCSRVEEIEHFYGITLADTFEGAVLTTVAGPMNDYLPGREWVIPIDGWYQCDLYHYINLRVIQLGVLHNSGKSTMHLDGKELSPGLACKSATSTADVAGTQDNWENASGSYLFYAEKGQTLKQHIVTKTADPNILVDQTLVAGFTGFSVHRVAKIKSPVN